MEKNYDSRRNIRKYIKKYSNVYNPDSRPSAPVAIYFVLGIPKTGISPALASEIQNEKDIVLLNVTENMNDGKTFTWFKWTFDTMFPKTPSVRFVAKLDEDEYFNPVSLAADLDTIWSQYDGQRIYYGLDVPYQSVPFRYMSGMGIFLSREIVEWVSTSQIPLKNLHGHEDQQVGKWFYLGNYTVRHVNAGRKKFHDWLGKPKAWNAYMNRISPASIIIHRCVTVNDFEHLDKMFCKDTC